MAATSIGQIVVEFQAEIAKFRADMEQVKQQLGQVANQTKSSTQAFNVFAGVSFDRLLAQLGDMITKSMQMARSAAQAEYAFKNLAGQANVSATALGRALEEASGNTIDLTNTMKAAG